MATLKVIFLCVLVTGGVQARNLLPQALEDVHKYVQKELSQRSQGNHGERRAMGMEGPPAPGGPAFQTSQTFIGSPVVIQKEIQLDGKGGVQMPGFPIHVGDPMAAMAPAASVNVAQVVAPPPPQAPLPTGLIPPVPLKLNHGDHQHQKQAVSASNVHPAIIPANVLGPSTFVSEAPRNYPAGPHPPPPPPPPQQYQQQQYQYNQQQQQRGPPPQQNEQQQQQNQKTMEGWTPLDNEGSQLAKGVGVKLTIDDDLRSPSSHPQQQQDRQPDYKDTGYSVNRPDQPNDNELEIIPTNSVKLGATAEDDIVVGIPKSDQKRFPVYPGRGTPNMIIHAQNVIIKSGLDGAIQEVVATNDTLAPGVHPAVKQFAAYQSVPQLNGYLRDQLRFAAMNHLIQSAIEEGHPLANKPFPRPLSLREIAQAVRNGQFPQPSRDQLLDPMATQSSMVNPQELQISIPHMVRMRPGLRRPPHDPLTLPSIHSHQARLPHPGIGLGNLYKNILQQEVAGAGGGGYDPRSPLEYSLLAALHGGRNKVPQAPQPKPPSTGDYGDNVKYTTGEQGKAPDGSENKEPVQIVETENQGNGLGGNLRDMSEQVLKQLLIQELQEAEQEPQILLPVGLGPQLPGGRRPLFSNLRGNYGTNAHPFAFLAEQAAAGQQDAPAVFEETFEYSLPPGANLDDYMNDDQLLHSLKAKRPKGHGGAYGHGLDAGGDPDSMPLNKDTFMKLGKSALSAALEFSRHHNPLTFISKVRSLPPVKVEMYKVPMGIPEGLMDKLPKQLRAGGGGGDGPPPHYRGPPPHDYDGPPPPDHRGPPPDHRGPPPDHRGPPPPRYRRRGGKKHQPRKHNKYH